MKEFNSEFFSLSWDLRVGAYGYMMQTLPEDVMQEIGVEVERIKNDFDKNIRVNNVLAGQISKEYQFNFGEKFIKFIQETCNTYELKSDGFIKKKLLNYPDDKLKNYFNYFLMDDKGGVPDNFMPDLKLSEGWINFQDPTEYNPPHQHSGILSFVIWYDIPYTKQEEIEFHRKKYIDKENISNGDFCFISSVNNNVSNVQIPADKSFNGTLCLFPSDLNHYVNPFYSTDQYRMTISSNIFLCNMDETLKRLDDITKIQ